MKRNKSYKHENGIKKIMKMFPEINLRYVNNDKTSCFKTMSSIQTDRQSKYVLFN